MTTFHLVREKNVETTSASPISFNAVVMPPCRGTAPFLMVAPPPVVVGHWTRSGAGALGMYATSSGCYVTLHRTREGMSL